jgi:phosphatidate cytidylyltransferase
MLINRLATACVLLAACLPAMLLLPNAAWTALLLPVLAVAGWEWGALAGWRRAGRALFCALLLISAMLTWWMSAGAARQTPVETAVYGAGVAFWLLLAFPWLFLLSRLRSPVVLGAAGWLVLVPAWLAFARLQENAAQLLALLVIVWLADSAAYFSGRAWGKRALAPAISPGKTWEGVAGAIAVVAVYYFALFFLTPGWGWWSGFGGAFLFASVTFMSILGDLFESAVKRQAGVKDSGVLLPGHGGLLDRIDSLTAALPVAALLAPCAGTVAPQ